MNSEDDGQATDMGYRGLNLSSDELAYIATKFAMSEPLSQRRTAEKWSQVEVARMIHSGQTRLAKTKEGDTTVSQGLLIKSLLAVGHHDEAWNEQPCVDCMSS